MDSRILPEKADQITHANPMNPTGPLARFHLGKLVFLKGEGLGSVCAVPEHLVGPNLEVDLDQYLSSGWASRNCGLNQNAIGSHLYPQEPPELVSRELALKYQEKLRKIGRTCELGHPYQPHPK